MGERLLDVPRCPVCGSADRADVSLGASVPVVRCRSCRTVHATQRADDADVFVDGYLGDAPGEFGLDLRGEAMQRYLRAAARRRLDVLHRRARPPGRLLDVGCGTGEFLAEAVAAGWSGAGVEPVAESADRARARGLEVMTGTTADLPASARGVDVVTACHVLEHLVDPGAFISELIACARPGGTVVVECPNYRSLLRRSAGASWRHLRPREHVVHYEPATLRGVLERSGLRDVTVTTPTYVDREQSARQQAADLGLRRTAPVLSALGPGRWAAVRAAERALRVAGVGDVIVATGTAPGQLTA